MVRGLIARHIMFPFPRACGIERVCAASSMIIALLTFPLACEM